VFPQREQGVTPHALNSTDRIVVLQQDLKAFLREMRVVRQALGDPFLPHPDHRNAIGETIGFVGARFVAIKP
jgi:hypothetical protein